MFTSIIILSHKLMLVAAKRVMQKRRSALSTHPAVRWESIAFVIDLAVAVEADPNETKRALLDAVM